MWPGHVAFEPAPPHGLREISLAIAGLVDVTVQLAER